MSRRPQFRGGKHFNRNRACKFQKPKQKQQNREYQYQNQLNEEDVGITQFITDTPGFSGVIKARFSDFQVNEIDLDGNIAKLTDQSIPKEFHKKKVVSEPIDLAQTPSEYIPQDTWVSIKSILDNDALSVELNVDKVPKEERAKIHQFLKTHLGAKVSANTVTTKEGNKIMHFKRYDKKTDSHFGQSEWPKNLPEYVYFIVYKECLDTLETCLKIADCLKVPPSNFTYAGVKDRRAKTSQWFCARKIQPWKLTIKTRSLRNIKIGNLTFKDAPLKLGQLKGNKFRIALRNVNGSDELIEMALNEVKDKGFINYYGLQRFGNNKEVPTYSIGVALLSGNWQKVCITSFVFCFVNYIQ